LQSDPHMQIHHRCGQGSNPTRSTETPWRL
jgi:hypothetical protein